MDHSPQNTNQAVREGVFVAGRPGSRRSFAHRDVLVGVEDRRTLNRRGTDLMASLRADAERCSVMERIRRLFGIH